MTVARRKFSDRPDALKPEGMELMSLRWQFADEPGRAAMRTASGRQELADRWRNGANDWAREFGWEGARALRAADALAGANWPALAQVLREVMDEDEVRHGYRHPEVRALAARFEQLPIGGTP